MGKIYLIVFLSLAFWDACAGNDRQSEDKSVFDGCVVVKSVSEPDNKLKISVDTNLCTEIKENTDFSAMLIMLKGKVHLEQEVRYLFSQRKGGGEMKPDKYIITTKHQGDIVVFDNLDKRESYRVAVGVDNGGFQKDADVYVHDQTFGGQ